MAGRTKALRRGGRRPSGGEEEGPVAERQKA